MDIVGMVYKLTDTIHSWWMFILYTKCNGYFKYSLNEVMYRWAVHQYHPFEWHLTIGIVSLLLASISYAIISALLAYYMSKYEAILILFVLYHFRNVGTIITFLFIVTTIYGNYIFMEMKGMYY